MSHHTPLGAGIVKKNTKTQRSHQCLMTPVTLKCVCDSVSRE